MIKTCLSQKTLKCSKKSMSRGQNRGHSIYTPRAKPAVFDMRTRNEFRERFVGSRAQPRTIKSPEVYAMLFPMKDDKIEVRTYRLTRLKTVQKFLF